jgi:hypothetical protein
MHRLIILLALGIACAKPPEAPRARTTDIQGRWVTDNEAGLVYHFWGDSAEVLLYPPQVGLPSTWRVRNDSVVVTSGATVSTHRFNIVGDSLLIDWNPGARASKMVRVHGTSGSGLAGSWRTRTNRDLMIVTFRSDSSLIGELGAEQFILRRGDMLVSRIGDGTLRQLLVRGGRGFMHIRTLDTPMVREVTLVSRPWGCFGRRDIDGDAVECR